MSASPHSRPPAPLPKLPQGEKHLDADAPRDRASRTLELGVLPGRPPSTEAASGRAGGGNRTRVVSLEGWSSTIELHPRAVSVAGCISRRRPSGSCRRSRSCTSSRRAATVRVAPALRPRRRARADLPRVLHRAAAACAAHVPLGAPAAERRARGVGAGAARARRSAGTRGARTRIRALRPFVALPVWIATYLALAPAVGLRLRAAPAALAAARRASDVPPAGIAVWWPVVHGTQSAGAKAAYLFAAFVLASPLGLLLALIPRPVYSFYAHAPRTWGPGPLVDQQIAGVTMAVEQAAVFFAVFAYLPAAVPARRGGDAGVACSRLRLAQERRRAARGFARPPR